MATIARLSVALTASTGMFTKAMKGAGNTVASFGSSLLGAVGKVAAYGTALTGLAVGAMTALVKSQMAAVDSAVKFADRMGIATEQMAALQLAADLAGVSNTALEKGLQQMTRGIADAADGTGEAVDALKQLGLSATALHAMSPADQFKAITAALEGVESQTEKVQVAYDLFGARGVALLNITKDGVAGLEEMERQTEATGLAFSRIDAAKIEMANDAFTMLLSTVKGIARQIAIQLAPFIKAVADRFTAAGTSGQHMSIKVAGGLQTILAGLGRIANAFGVLRRLQLGLQKLFLEYSQVFDKVTAAIMDGIRAVGNLVGLELKGLEAAAQRSREMAEGAAAAIKDIDKEIEASKAIDYARDFGDLIAKIQADAEAAAAAIASQAPPIEELTEGLDALEAASLTAADGMKGLEQAAKRIFEQTRSPLEQFETQMAELKDLLSKGLIDQDTFGRAVKQAEETLAGLSKPVEVKAPKTADLQQVNLSRIALGRPSGASRRQEVQDPQLQRTNALLAKIERRVGVARAG